MAELNLDISQELNITARRGDSISFTLTFRDSDGDALNLNTQIVGGDDAFVSFFMEVRTASDDDSTTPVLRTKEVSTETLPQSGADTLDGATGEIVVGTGSYESGQVTFSIASSVMKNVFAGVYVYDIEYYAENQDASKTNKQTWVRGTFTVNEDVTITT